MKNTLTSITLALALCGAGSAAVAGDPAPPSGPAVSAPAADPARKPDAGHRVNRDGCEPVTGSRLSRPPGPDGKCDPNPQVGRTYTQDDVERTGSTDLGDAIRKLDPNVR